MLLLAKPPSASVTVLAGLACPGVWELGQQNMADFLVLCLGHERS